MRTYDPGHIECFPSTLVPAPPLNACRFVLDSVTFSHTVEPFGRPGVLPRVALPQAWSDITSSCTFIADIEEGFTVDGASWADLWYAGVAITTICVSNGMGGGSVYLGEP